MQLSGVLRHSIASIVIRSALGRGAREVRREDDAKMCLCCRADDSRGLFSLLVISVNVGHRRDEYEKWLLARVVFF